MATKEAEHTERQADAEADSMFIGRWSPRAFTGEPLTLADVRSLVEAARWAPSSYNAQPWRFVYALKGTPAWDKLFSLLVPFKDSGPISMRILYCLCIAFLSAL